MRLGNLLPFKVTHVVFFVERDLLDWLISININVTKNNVIECGKDHSDGEEVIHSISFLKLEP